MGPDDISLHQAARGLGVPLSVLRRAIRDGRVPRPTHATALGWAPAQWMEDIRTAEEAAAGSVLKRAKRQAVPAFARYEGTSAWKHNGRKPPPR